MNERVRTPNLMDEYPLLVYPSLAETMGINKAVVFQQLHFLLNAQKTSKNDYVFVDEHWWVYNTYQEWKETYFSWLSTVQLQRIFSDLQKDGLIRTKQSVKNKSDRRKWYTIDYEAWNKYHQTIISKRYDEPSYQNDTINNVSKRNDGYSDTTSKTTTERESRKRSHPIFSIKYPSNIRSYTAKHIEAYQQEHTTEMTALVQAWAGKMYAAITEFGKSEGQMYIEVHQELNRLHITTDDYSALATFAKTKNKWKTDKGDKVWVKAMLDFVTEYKTKPKKIIYDDPLMDLTIPQPEILSVFQQAEKERKARENHG